MRKLLLTTILFAGLFHVHGQTVHVDFSYDYLYNKQWNKLIQTYNESHPFLDEKQPLFQHGIHAATGYHFPLGTRMSIDSFVSVQCLQGFYFPGIERGVN